MDPYDAEKWMYITSVPWKLRYTCLACGNITNKLHDIKNLLCEGKKIYNLQDSIISSRIDAIRKRRARFENRQFTTGAENAILDGPNTLSDSRILMFEIAMLQIEEYREHTWCAAYKLRGRKIPEKTIETACYYILESLEACCPRCSGVTTNLLSKSEKQEIERIKGFVKPLSGKTVVNSASPTYSLPQTTRKPSKPKNGSAIPETAIETDLINEIDTIMEDKDYWTEIEKIRVVGYSCLNDRILALRILKRKWSKRKAGKVWELRYSPGSFSWNDDLYLPTLELRAAATLFLLRIIPERVEIVRTTKTGKNRVKAIKIGVNREIKSLNYLDEN
jgi:hypothetical protein